MKSFLTATLCLSALAALPAEASSWCHEGYGANDGSNVRMDYQVQDYFSRFEGHYSGRTNMWVHISNPRFTGKEQVRVLVLNYSTASGGERGEFRNTAFEGEASYDASSARFTIGGANADAPITGNSLQGYQEIAVVVDGRWLKAANNPSSNLVFDARKYPQYCANGN